MQPINDRFSQAYDPRWHIGAIGAGRVHHQPGALHLTLPACNHHRYSDAQITDYDPSRRNFQYGPPLRLDVMARASHPASGLLGTAGFGFWNHAFAPNERGIRLPRALWFFFSGSPSRMVLARDVPATGWKAATFNPNGYTLAGLLPLALPGMLLMRIPALYRLLWPVGQRALGVSEALLDGDLLRSTHSYRLDWLPDGVHFYVDDQLVLQTQSAPRQALGFISWIDNQYAIVTPQGQFGFGLVDVPQSQSLILEQVRIQPL